MIRFKDFLFVTNETSSLNEEESLNLSEVLSFAARRKRSIEMKRRKQKLKQQRKIAAKRPASLEKLKKRSRRAARNVLTKRFSGGKSRSNMSIAQKARSEKRVSQAKTQLKTISKKLLPSKKRLDVSRRGR